MEYTINKLSKIANVSARTLRYYDEIDLLKPARINSSGYRIYGQDEIDTLQQILFFRELGFNLEGIKEIISNADFDREKALSDHLLALLKKREQIDMLINTVTKTIGAVKGEMIMTDQEKFEGFKQKLIADNEQQYGAEIREKYGDDAIDASNAKLKGMSTEQYAEIERLSLELEGTLKAAFETGDPAGELAQKACEIHKKWLCFYNDNYSKEYHKQLGEMYVAEERFTAYYDKIAVGCAKFLRDAINIYCRGQ